MKDRVEGQERAAMDAVVVGMSVTAEKIRALHLAGYEPAKSAGYLGIRYQHVHNVLKRSLPERLKVKVGPGGRIVIPVGYRQALNVKEGDQVTLRLDNGEVHIISPAAAIRRAQDLIAEYVPADVSLVDELIAERRREAAREASGE